MLHDLYKGFKKVAEDDASATLRHENGHELSLAKSGLSKQQIKSLEKLPIHQAEGGTAKKEEAQMPAQQMQQPVEENAPSMSRQVGKFLGENVVKHMMEGVAETVMAPVKVGKMVGDAAVQSVKDVAPLVIEPAKAIYNVGKDVGSGVLEGVTGKAPAPAAPAAAPQQPAQPGQQAANEELVQSGAAQGPLTPEEQIQQELSPQQLAEQAPAPAVAPAPAQPVQPRAVSAAAPAAPLAPQKPAPLPSILRDQKEVMFDNSLPVSERMAASQNVLNDITNRIAAAEKDFQTKMATEDIDPDRVFNNMSTGRKIRTVIGVLLGGAGAGLAGGENLALSMLNREIERDVELQKSNREKKFNLFKMHLETLGNERAATLQTMNNLRDIADMKMKETLQNLDPNNRAAKTALEAGIAKNLLEKRKAHQEMATIEMDEMWKKQNKMATEGALAASAYEPKEYRERGFNVMVPGKSGKLETRRLYAVDAAQAAKAKEKSAAIENVREVYNRIVNFNTTKGRAFGDVERGEAEALNKEMEVALADLATSGVTEKTIKAMEGLAPKAGAWKQGAQAAKTVGFNRYLNAETNQLIKQFKQ